MKRLPKRYIHLLMFSGLILLTFFIVAGSFIVSHQRNLLLDNEQHHASVELDLIGGFVQESFITKDFAKVNRFLQDWVEKRPYIIEMSATSRNGFKFFSHRSDTIAKHSFTIEKTVSFPPNNEIYLIVKHDLMPMESIISRLNWQLLFIFSVIVIFLGLILSFTLTKVAFIPMEQEIQRRIAEVNSAHEDLEKMSRQHQLILESVGDGICGLSSEGLITFINPAAAQILETPAKFLIGKHYLTATSHARGDRSFYNKASCPVCSAVKRGVIHRANDEYILTPSGRLLPIEYISTPLIEQADPKRYGDILGGVVVFRDITRQKQAEMTLKHAKEAAEQANRAKNQFLANISHELRTPLNAIIGYSEILYEDTLSDGYDEFAEYSHNVLTAGQQLLGLIDDVLDIAKIESGSMSLNLEQINLHQLINDVMTTVQPLVQQNNNTLDVKYNTNVKVIMTDAVKLRQIMLNLLNNAAKFTHSGHIDIKLNTQVQRHQHYLFIHIQDNGIGMNEAQQANLFKAFQQADNSSTREYGGMGLGLTLTKEFVEMLEGKISVQSELGMGSVFCIQFPLKEDH
ncbi:ATP-binding protein [Candidatus Albibeggiatoa sp. nov. NOAA]|uniref:PAS domain-containing sensor histidine kinase n=1 Tax=Candidatus Albibeggiatoa sp. nov. NOAA TaxID=3162724 RepID=UPI0032F7410B|nr:ATP-binding protein [Thiotrichaceae bacterium]